MTVGEWLRARTPQPPPDLAARLDAVLGAALAEPAERAPEVLLAAGERLVAELLLSRSTSRESALDLLTADALITYAFEGETDTPLDIEQRADATMTRIASIGAGEV